MSKRSNKFKPPKILLTTFYSLLISLLLTSCSISTKPEIKQQPIKPTAIYPAPASVLAGAAVQITGAEWILAGSPTAKVAYQIDLISGSIVSQFPVNATASSIAEIPNGSVLIGNSHGSVGSIDVYSLQTHAHLASWALPGPIISLRTGAAGIVALMRSNNAESVAVLNEFGAIQHIFPVSLSTVAVSPEMLTTTIYLLQSNGTVSASSPSGAISTEFKAAKSGQNLAVNPNGSSIYVLKGPLNAPNVSSIDLQTEQTTTVLPAPTNCVGIFLSPDSSYLYMLVGTPTLGNIQVFHLQ